MKCTECTNTTTSSTAIFYISIFFDEVSTLVIHNRNRWQWGLWKYSFFILSVKKVCLPFRVLSLSTETYQKKYIVSLFSNDAGKIGKANWEYGRVWVESFPFFSLFHSWIIKVRFIVVLSNLSVSKQWTSVWSDCCRNNNELGRCVTVESKSTLSKHKRVQSAVFILAWINPFRFSFPSKFCFKGSNVERFV